MHFLQVDRCPVHVVFELTAKLDAISRERLPSGLGVGARRLLRKPRVDEEQPLVGEKAAQVLLLLEYSAAVLELPESLDARRRDELESLARKQHSREQFLVAHALATARPTVSVLTRTRRQVAAHLEVAVELRFGSKRKQLAICGARRFSGEIAGSMGLAPHRWP